MLELSTQNDDRLFDSALAINQVLQTVMGGI